MTMPAVQAPPQGRARVTPTASKTPPRPPAGPRPRRVPLTPMRQQAAKSMRRLAQHIQQDHPELSVHAHVRDAARMLESGNEEAAQRHLRAAVFALTPQSLHRQGVHDDIGHISARQAVHGVHRHLLLVKDIADVAERNQRAIARDSYGDDSSAPSLPSSPVHADPNAGYGPGALAQKPTQRQPGGDRALNAPARMNSGGSDPAVADPVGPQPRGSKQFSYTWDDLAAVVELSARTAQLEVTPAPYGKPGGPGLYNVKGLKHSDYLEQIVKALMRKGMDKGRATAIARGSIRKWMIKSKHPEVRAAAAGAEAEELKAQARAHAHAATWEDVAAVVELATVRGWDGVALELATVTALNNPSGNPSQPRVQSGPATGQFTQAQQQQAKSKAAAKGKQPAKPAAKGKPQQTPAQAKAAQKAGLLKTASADRVKAAGIAKQITALQKIIAAAQAGTGKTVSAASNVTKTTAGSTTAASASTKAAAASSAASKTASATAKATVTATQAKKMIGPLQAQYKTLMGQAATATAQAAKL